MPHVRILLAALLFTLAGVVNAQASDITRANVLRLINAYRVTNGVDALSEDARLDEAADDRMSDMEEQGYWSHTPPDGSSPFALFRKHGYDYVSAGENLARGFETAELLVSSWMESEGHRQNILGSQYHELGISIIPGSTVKRSDGDSIVVVFGRQREVAATKKP